MENFMEEDDAPASRLFLYGIIAFVALVAGAFFYASRLTINVPTKVVTIDVPIPNATAGSTLIDPDTAPPVAPRGVPNFAIPSEEPAPLAPLPPVTKPAETTATPADKPAAAGE